MGRGRKRYRRRSTEAQSLQEPQFSQAVIPNKKRTAAVNASEAATPVGAFDKIPTAIGCELVPVVPEDVDAIWPLASALIAPELPQTDWTDEQLREACANGVATLWMICDQNDEARAAMVTILTPQQRCIVAICCGTNLWDYLDARSQLYDWAKEMGMKEVTFYGRDALVKLMPECKRAGVILRKEL